MQISQPWVGRIYPLVFRRIYFSLIVKHSLNFQLSYFNYDTFQNNRKSFHPLMLRLFNRVAIHTLLRKETVLLLDVMWNWIKGHFLSRLQCASSFGSSGVSGGYWCADRALWAGPSVACLSGKCMRRAKLWVWDSVCKAFSSAQLAVNLQCGLCLWPQHKAV